jgi:uncharacterized membrane protein YcaP (DUF421 family)
MIDLFFKIDWHRLFFPSLSIAELFIRGSVVYLVLFSLLRHLPNRQIGAVGITDLLVVLLFTNAAQNAMVSNYTSITDGLILVATVVFWSYALNWLNYRFPALQRFFTAPPLILVKNGRMIHRNMRREMITDNELMSQLRKQGVDNLAAVKQAFMEADGSISVIEKDVKSEKPIKPQRTSI